MKFKIYVKNSCAVCASVMRLLESKGIPYEVLSTDGRPELLTEAKTKYRYATVPLIVETSNGYDKVIGGYQDLVEYLKSSRTLLHD